MGMATAQKLWTAAEVRALPDYGRRYEVIDGRLLVNGVLVPGGDLELLGEMVTPAPSWSHQRAVTALWSRLTAYVLEHALGDVLIAPADVEYSDTVAVQPDVFVIPLVAGRKPPAWEQVRRLLLAAEVVSPTSARADRIVKRRLYQREGVPEYWVIDLDARTIDRWRPEDDRPELLSERIEWQPEPTVPPLVIDLADYFADALGE